MEGGKETSCVVIGTGNCHVKLGKVDDAIIIPSGDGQEENTGLTDVCACVNLPDYSGSIISCECAQTIATYRTKIDKMYVDDTQ